MIRRTLMATVALTATAALVLTGCGRSDEASTGDAALELTDSPATGTITVWAQGTEGEALQDFVRPFEEANPDVTIKVTPVPWGDALNKYQTAVAGGATPDIGMLGSDWMPGFEGALLAKPDAIDTSGIFPFATASTEFDGTEHAVPWYVETRLIFFRSDIASELGFDEFPTDWDGFTELAQAYKDNGAKYSISIPSGGWNAFLSNLPFVWSNGGEIMNADQTEWTLDTSETAGALEFLDGFFDAGLANKNPDGETASTAAAFVDGSTPMFLSGPWDVPGLETAGGADFADKFNVAQIPTAPGGTSTSFAAGSNLAVFEGSENAESAWKLIDWLSQPEVQVEWFKTVNGLPSQQSAWDDPALTADPKVAVFGQQLQSVKTAPNLTAWNQVSAAADTQIEQIFRGDKPVADALADLQATADSLGTGR